ncbi:c-type cytochrome [Burkholderia ubonensis]|nr:c-type cytochrome [Burkholderia ubonensis]
MLVKDCMLCHDGRTASGIPSIHGQRRAYLTEALQRLRASGGRGTVMQRMMRGYSDKDIERMADYFSQQKPASPGRDPARSTLPGQVVYQARCASCHAADDSAMPRILGQDRQYLVYRIRDFLYYGHPIPIEMKSALLGLSKQELEDLLNYLGAQR